MDPKAGLRPYLQRDIDDILEALVDNDGNVNSQILVKVNGVDRLVNVGLIKYVAEWLYNRPVAQPIDDVIAEVAKCAFINYVDQYDTLEGVRLKRKLVSLGLTKRGNTLMFSGIYKRCINGKTFGEDIKVHYYNDALTKYQQTYIMHLLLALGDRGHAGQGMADWDFYVNTTEDEVKFNIKL